MATTIRLEYFGMPGEGPTVKEAKADAGRKIEAAFAEGPGKGGYYAPLVLSHRGKLLVASRHPLRGWGYRLDSDLFEKCYQEFSHCSGGFASFSECREAAVRHLADLTRIEGETDSPLFDALPERNRDEVRRDMQYRWGRNDVANERYRLAIANGYNANDAHDYAWCNPMRPELWRDVNLEESVA